MTVTFIGDADVLDWLRSAAEDPTMEFWKFTIETAIDDIERYRADLKAISSGDVVIMPSSMEHAEAMHLIAEKYISDNRK